MIAVLPGTLEFIIIISISIIIIISISIIIIPWCDRPVFKVLLDMIRLSRPYRNEEWWAERSWFSTTQLLLPYIVYLPKLWIGIDLI